MEYEGSIPSPWPLRLGVAYGGNRAVVKPRAKDAPRSQVALGPQHPSHNSPKPLPPAWQQRLTLYLVLAFLVAVVG